MNQENQKQNQHSANAGNQKQSLDGTGQSSQWEKAVASIAGDNQLMSALLKLLLSPFTLLAGAGIIIYLFIKNKDLKEEVEKLKSENKKFIEEALELAKEADKNKKKFKNLKKVFKIGENQTEQRVLSQGLNYPNKQSTFVHNVSKNKTTYLD